MNWFLPAMSIFSQSGALCTENTWIHLLIFLHKTICQKTAQSSRLCLCNCPLSSVNLFSRVEIYSAILKCRIRTAYFVSFYSLLILFFGLSIGTNSIIVATCSRRSWHANLFHQGSHMVLFFLLREVEKIIMIG